MNPHLHQLNLSLSAVKSEIKIRTDNINRLTWERDELEKDKTQLLMEIEQAKMCRSNPCLDRVL